MILLYHILSTLVAIIVIPCFAVASLFSKHKFGHLLQHFGFVPTVRKESGQKTLWVHALSMGEVNAAAPVLKQVHNDRPELRIVVSVTTDSGYESAKRNLPFAEPIFFHPLDCLPFTTLALNKIQPDLFVLMDTGVWPGLLNLLKRRNVPALLLNGRMSKKSFRRYKKLGSFMTETFNSFSLLCMQNEQGAQGMRDLGVPAEKVQVTGNPKLDALKSMSDPERARLKESFRIPAGNPVWVAGSAHEGEEEIILTVYRNLKEKHEGLVLVLAPRRTERIGQICNLLNEKKIPFVRRSGLTPTSPFNRDVILLDTMGHLVDVYAIGEIAFVGRSLITPGGGHSLTEPVAQGRPVLHGPNVENERHNADELGKCGLAFEVKNAAEMQDTLDQLLNDPARLAQIADKAKSYIESHQGASKKLAEIILEKLTA